MASLLLWLILLYIGYCNCCPTNYTFCSNQAQTCAASGVIAYGIGTRYTYQESIGSIACTNSQFGNPVTGSKECCLQQVPITGPVTPIVGIISCGETVHSFFKNVYDIHYWKLATTNFNTITYTTCESTFDTRVHVYNDTGDVISIPYCPEAPTTDPFNPTDPTKTGDDCNEEQCILDNNNEFFTMPSQLAGTYYIKVISYDNDGSGNYQLFVSCSLIPTNSPTPAPTNNPTPSPTGYPTPAPTSNPTSSPLHNPSAAPTHSTSAPTYTPTSESKSPTKYPTNYPSSIPTGNPTKSPIEPLNAVGRPTSSPTMTYNDLLFVCYYNGVNKYIVTEYMNLLRNQILSTFDVISSALWAGSGITKLEICTVFTDTILSNSCPVYQINSKTDADYVTIALFGIATDSSIDLYKKHIIDTMESDEFKDAFTNNMNNALNDMGNSQRRRRDLLNANNFETVYIEVIDTKNYTISNENAINNEETKSDDTIIIVVVVIIILILIGVVLGIYFYRKRKNQETKGAMTNEIEMNTTKHQNYGQGIFVETDGKIQNQTDDTDNMGINDTNDHQYIVPGSPIHIPPVIPPPVTDAGNNNDEESEESDESPGNITLGHTKENEPGQVNDEDVVNVINDTPGYPYNN